MYMYKSPPLSPPPPLLPSSPPTLQISYYFPHKVMWRSFFAALTAAFTLQLMNPYFSGHLVLFFANYNHEWHLFEFLPFLLIGVFGVSVCASVRGRREGGEGGESMIIGLYLP